MGRHLRPAQVQQLKALCEYLLSFLFTSSLDLPACLRAGEHATMVICVLLLTRSACGNAQYRSKGF
jgi:hypothetical protein